MGRLLAQQDIDMDNLNASPRLRVNRSASFPLSLSWQTIDFNGSSTFNVNTFPLMGSTTSVGWDTTNKKFTFAQDTDRNYNVTLYYHVTAPLVPANIQFRFCIPAPTPVYFPFPDTRQYLDLVTVYGITDHGFEYSTTIYANALVRQYGLQMQIRVGASLLTLPTLADCAAVIYGA